MWGRACASVSGHIMGDFNVFFSLLYTPFSAWGTLFLFLEDLHQKWPLPDALAHASSHWRVHSSHPRPRALQVCGHPRSFSITVLAWSLCLPGGNVVASLYPLASPASTKLSAVHILGPSEWNILNLPWSFLDRFLLLWVTTVNWKKN